mgnify:CR=1 FL=1
MASIWDVGTAVEILKRLYPQGIKDIWYARDPVASLFKEWTGFGGEGKFLVWRFAPGGGGSADFAVAQGNQAAAAYKRPFITRKKDYGVGTISREMLLASQGDSNALATAFDQAVSAARYSIARSLAHSTLSDGTGRRAQATSTTTTTVITVDASQTSRFEIGMVVQACDATGATLRVGSAEILEVHPFVTATTTEIVTTANWDTLITGFVITDWLIRAGDFNAVAFGISTWVPDVAPTTTDVTGVDRSVYPTRLAGIRYTATETLVSESVINAAAVGSSLGTMDKADIAILNPLDFAALENQTTAKVVIYLPIPSDPNIIVNKVMLSTPVGSLGCISAPMQARGRIHLLDTSSWERWSLGEMPALFENQGNRSVFFPQPNADAYEIRLGGYFNNVCTDPGANMVILKSGGWS